MNYDSTFYSPNQASSKFDFLMMQQSLNAKSSQKIEKALSAKNNSIQDRFKNDKYDEFSDLIMQSSSPTNLKSEPIAMMTSVQQSIDNEVTKSAVLVGGNASFQANNSSASSTSSALSTCSLSSSPQQNNMMLINNEPLYISSSLSEASSPPVSSVSSGSSNKHVGPDDHYNQCQTGTDGYLDSSMSDDMDMTGNGCYGQVPCIGNEMDNGRNNMSSLSSRTNRFFPDDVVDILNRWFSENQDYPYPDEHMTNVLAREANISAKQVRKWFANKRVRSNKCYKQNFKIKKDKQLSGSPKHSKSVSECDGLIKDENRLYSDNEEIDDCFDQDNVRSYGPSNGYMMMNGTADHHNQHLASDCELGMADISQAAKPSKSKNKNKRFSYDFTSIPASYAYSKYCSNPSSSSSSFTSSSPISHFDYTCGSNNASASFGNANGSPLLASNNTTPPGAYDLHDTHFSFVPNHGTAQRAQQIPPQQPQPQPQQQQHMFRSTSAHTAQELLYNLSMWKNAMSQNPSLALQNSLQTAHQQSQTIPSNLNLLQNIDNNVVVNRLNSLAAAASAVNAAKSESSVSTSNPATKPTDASLLCNNNQTNASLPTSAATSPSLQPQQQTTSSVTAIAAALCNQYYLMNLLQNPLAMQAALANRFLMLNQNSPSSTATDAVKVSQESSKNAKSSVNSNKRKSQLTKCFYNETSSPVHSTLPSDSTKQPSLNRIKTPTTQTPTQKPAKQEPELPNKQASQLLVLASALSFQQQQQAAAAAAAPALQQPSTSPVDCVSIRRNKINFGVVSDLIN